LAGVAERAAAACAEPTLNAFLEMGRPVWRDFRRALFGLLEEKAAHGTARDDVARCLIPQSEAEYAIPVRIGDYSDFYTSYYHAVNIGRMFEITTEGSNFEWIPIAYHGRVSSIDISGQKINGRSGRQNLSMRKCRRFVRRRNSLRSGDRDLRGRRQYARQPHNPG
jgi:fumarylacetoacetase